MYSLERLQSCWEFKNTPLKFQALLVQQFGSFDDTFIFIPLSFLETLQIIVLFSSPDISIWSFIANFNISGIYCVFPVLMSSPCVLRHVHKLAVLGFRMFSHYGMSTLIRLQSETFWTVSVCVNIWVQCGTCVCLWIEKKISISTEYFTFPPDCCSIA